jgi:transposase InsO family protein
MQRIVLTDITEHPTAEGKLYLCAVKDACSKRIVGYSIDSRMKSSLAVAAIRNAIGLRRSNGTVVHSDRGSQFRSAKFVRTLRDAGLACSMGRVGACADNAAMESSSPGCRRTCSTPNAGRQERSSNLRSCPGSNGPITAGVANAVSASSPRSSSRPCSRSPMRPEGCQPSVSTEVWAVPPLCRKEVVS